MVFTGFLICPIDPRGIGQFGPQELHWQGLCSGPLGIAFKVFPIKNSSFIGRVYVVINWTLLLMFFP